MSETKKGSSWKPYENATLLNHPAPYTAAWYRTRFSVLYPLSKQVSPCIDFTYGELLTCLVALIGTIYTFTLTDLEKTGSASAVPCGLTFALATHNSVFTFFLGLPFERALRYHKLFAFVTIITGAWHGYVATYLPTKEEGSSVTKTLGWDFTDFHWETGFFFELFMILMVLLAWTPIRRKLFEAFYRIHVALVFLVGVMGLAHGAGAFMFGGFLYLCDVTIRYFYMVGSKNPQEATILALPANVVRITFPRAGFNYKAGQYIFICVPSLSIFQWHPFSISSAPDQPDVTLHVRVLGNWTKSLYDLATKRAGPQQHKVYLEGPYGSPSVDIDSDRYKCVLLLSGGIGITPMQSLCNDLIAQHDNGRPLVKVWFVWSCRDKSLVTSMNQGVELPHHGGSEGGHVELPQRLPDSFSPDVLRRVGHSVRRIGGADDADPTEGKAEGEADEFAGQDNDAEFLHTEFFLTRAKTSADMEGQGISPELRRCLHKGRPNLPQIFAKMKAIAGRNSVDKVAVLTCGPTPMVDQAKRLCWSESGDGVQFDFHTETFAF